MAKRNRFTRLIAALFLAALVLFAFSSLSADANDPGTGPCPVEPGDTAIAGTQNTNPPEGSDITTDLYTAAYLLLVVL